MQSMTTAEATVASLITHGIDTIYALPGVHNDFLFDALFKAGDQIRTVHTRHEQGAAYMALGAALATNRPHPYAVVPGPGLLNTGAALLTAYATNAPVLGLIGQIPNDHIGKGIGHLHEVRDQAGIISRLVDFSARIRSPETASRLVAEAMRAMYSGRPGPAVIECAIDMWGRPAPMELVKPLPVPPTKIDEDAIAEAANKLGAAKRPLIICGGGAQDCSDTVTQLSDMLQAPVLAYRRGRGVLDGRSPFAVTLPLGRDLWAEADVVLAVGTHMYIQHIQWGIDDDVAVIRVNADAEEVARVHRPAVALVGDSKPILRRLVDAVSRQNRKRDSRLSDMKARQAHWHERMKNKIGPQIAFLEAIRDELPEDGILVEEVTQIGFAARLAYPVYKPRTFLSPGYQDNLGWGFATALGAADARRDVPVIAISGDGGFMFTANEMATAVRHAIPLTVIVFADGAFGNVRRIQQERYGNHVIASDLANPDFIRFAESFGANAERARNPEELRSALRRSIARRDAPTLIEVPVGAFPSPWEFIQMPKVRGI
jgi:acetolactate synthase-1/2/3 large subunit